MRGQSVRRLVSKTSVGLLLGFHLVAAQGTTGKIEGTVTDSAGIPVANAQILIPGTAFGAVTGERGYYFLINVPVGTHTLRVQRIGYAVTELRNVRVLGGQTITANVIIRPSAVVVSGIVVEAQINPAVPRDQVTSKSIVAGDLVNSLPVDDVRQVVALQPGVVESGSARGVSIRGGRPGDANLYVDGVPVRATNSGIPHLEVGTNAVEEASVTTGALPVELSDAQSGIIALTTRAGGSLLRGSLSYESDEPFGNSISLGFNRFEGSVGGSVPGVRNLRFFGAGVLQGQLSQERGWGQDRNATYVVSGLDTTVQIADTLGTVAEVRIPRYVQFSGQCPGGADPSNTARDAILKNYGFPCQGRRFPMDWATTIQLQGKLQYTYGLGSSAALTGLASGNQRRDWPGTEIGDPGLFPGTHKWSRAVILNLSHQVSKAAERALAVNASLSWQQDNEITGLLDPSYELGTRSPALGLELGTMRFAGFEGMPFPVTEQIVRNVRTNTGLRVPLLNRTDLRNSQPYRLNPFGMASGGWTTQGLDFTSFDIGRPTLYHENRYIGRLFLDWQANRYNRITLGGDATKTDLARWSGGLLSQVGMDVYVVHPVKYGLYAADRLDLGDFVLELGIRYDYYNSHALFAKTPLRVFSNPAWSTDAATNDDSLAAAVARVFDPAVGHSTLSPRLRVSFPITEHTDFRLSYAHQVQSPDLQNVVRRINNDFAFGAFSAGRDVAFGKTILFELGIRHAFSADLIVDAAAYYKAKGSDLTYRIVSYDDPANPGKTLNPAILTNADFGNSRGVELKLDRRVGRWLNAAVAYTFQDSRSTGSDPLSYFANARYSQVTGALTPPPEAPTPTDDNRTHNLAGSLAVSVPEDWRRGTTLGTMLDNVGLYATFRFVSGLPYTRPLSNGGAGIIGPGGGTPLTTATDPINSSNLPWTRNIDLRINKGFRIGFREWTLYADIRNLLNFKNIVQLFTETGGVANDLYRVGVLSSEFSNLAGEASLQPVSMLRSDGSIDLSDCTQWTSVSSALVNCVMLQRAEARFGNGDRNYSLAEQSKALNAYYDMLSGAQWFYGPPRSVRLGMELTF